MPTRLLLVAHGTASPVGSATTASLVDALRAERPDVSVRLCFLDVARPLLADALDGPAVVVPLLLSTGYHVQTDIPAAIDGHPDVRVARHLGPDPLLVDVLADRLSSLSPGGSTVLVAAGSSRPEAAAEIATTARLLGERLGNSIPTLTFGDDLRAGFGGLPGPVRVATYLLAEGRFVDELHSALDGFGTAAAPLGVHPALVRLVWRRYDDAS